jgi:hypothetical protein
VLPNVTYGADFSHKGTQSFSCIPQSIQTTHKPCAIGARLAACTRKYGIGELFSGLGFYMHAARVYTRSGTGSADICLDAYVTLRFAAFYNVIPACFSRT